MPERTKNPVCYLCGREGRHLFSFRPHRSNPMVCFLNDCPSRQFGKPPLTFTLPKFEPETIDRLKKLEAEFNQGFNVTNWKGIVEPKPSPKPLSFPFIGPGT